MLKFQNVIFPKCKYDFNSKLNSFSLMITFEDLDINSTVTLKRVSVR